MMEKNNETEINQILYEAELFCYYASPRDGLMVR